MSDKILRLYFQKKCKLCKGTGIVRWGIAPEEKECITCQGKGYTDEVMEFEWNGYYEKWALNVEGKPTKPHIYYLSIEENGLRVIDRQSKPADITDSLNPTHLEFVDLKGCPKCEEYFAEAGKKWGNDNLDDENHNCTDGKIEVVTQLVIFDKVEYDAAVIGGFSEKINKFIPIGLLNRMTKEKLGNALVNINNLINGLSDKGKKALKPTGGESG